MNNYHEAVKGEYTISTDPARLDVPLIHRYLSEDSYWSQQIPYVIVEKSIQGSLCFGLYKGTAQIGFARLITDQTTFAYMADVFILPENRGNGLSVWLMEIIHTHPSLSTVRSWLLTTTDAHGLYRKFGYATHPNPEKIMRRYIPVSFTEHQ